MASTVMPKSSRMPSDRSQTTPWMLSLLPSFHALCTTGTRPTFITCCVTFSSTKSWTFFSSLPMRLTLNLLLSQRRWLNHDYKGPQSFLLKAALTPPQPQWPAMMMSSTLRCSTANCITASTLMSEGGATLAMFLCTKTSPGLSPMISLAGTLESEQPIHRYLGAWTPTNLVKQSGSLSTHLAAHSLLFLRICWKLEIWGCEGPEQNPLARRAVRGLFLLRRKLFSIIIGNLYRKLRQLIYIQGAHAEQKASQCQRVCKIRPVSEYLVFFSLRIRTMANHIYQSRLSEGKYFNYLFNITHIILKYFQAPRHSENKGRGYEQRIQRFQLFIDQ